jgi:hypothetical protein
MGAAASYPHACPKCGGTILWCDGAPAPELMLKVEADGSASQIVGCTRCIGPNAPPRAPSAPLRAPRSILGGPAAPRDGRPVRQILHEEGSKVVDLLAQGFDIAERVGDLWKKLTPRK